VIGKMADEADAPPEAPPEVVLNERELSFGLLNAAKAGRAALAARLLALGADPLCADAKGWAPLHHACFYGHAEVVELLLRAGAGDAYKDDASMFSGHAALSPGSPVPAGCGGGGAGGAPSRARRVLRSPLHVAVTRGHLRCVWALLFAGISPLDLDNMGHNALLLAAAAPIPSPTVRLELLQTLMCAGFDPAERNWAGFTAAELLPPVEAGGEAARLLARAAAAGACAATGAPFSAEGQRFLCASSGRFFSEGASSPAVVHAFAPAIPGVTVPALGAGAGGASLPPLSAAGDAPLAPAAPLADGIDYGVLQSSDGLLLAVWPGDDAVLRPIRLGASASYRVADAEAALEAAMRPCGLEGALHAAEKAAVVAAAAAREAARVAAQEARAAAFVAAQEAAAAPGRAAREAAAACTELVLKGAAAGKKTPPAVDAVLRAVSILLDGDGSGADGKKLCAAGAPTAARIAELDVDARGMSEEKVAALRAVTSLRAGEPDASQKVTFSVEAVGAVSKDAGVIAAWAVAVVGWLDAPHAPVEEVAEVGDAISGEDGAEGKADESKETVGGEGKEWEEGDGVGPMSPLSAAASPGVRPTMLPSLNNPPTHAAQVYDALPYELHALPSHRATLAAAIAAGRDARVDVQVLARALKFLHRLGASARAVRAAATLAAARPLSSRGDAALAAAAVACDAAAAAGAGASLLCQLRVGRELAAAELSLANAVDAAGRIAVAGHSDDGLVARLGAALGACEAIAARASLAASGEVADAGVGQEGAPRLALPVPAGNAPAAPPVPQAALDAASALHRRLVAEVGLSDFVAAVGAAEHAAAAASLVHKEEDPTLLPTPAKPPPDPEAVAAAAAAAAATAAKKPPPKPPAKGSPPPVEEPPPHPPVDPTLPCDATGTPLPHTPQLLALFALRDAVKQLEAAALSGCAAGADAGAVDAANAAAARGMEAMGKGMMEECLRVEHARAAAKKKGKGKKH
jgi:hypothetical protein